MVNQPRNLRPQSCPIGKPEEDQNSIGIDLPAEAALFIGPIHRLLHSGASLPDL